MTRNDPGREEFQVRRDSESLLSLCVEAKCRDTVDLALSFMTLRWGNGVERLEDLLLIVRGSLVMKRKCVSGGKNQECDFMQID